MAKDRETIVDIESNQSECREDPRYEQVTDDISVKNMLRSLGLTLSFNGLDDAENSSDIESLVNNKPEDEKRENMPLIGKTHSKERQKVKNSKRASKPPRPRKGPSLSASDLRLVKEISEMVMKKRARIERLKSLKKARSARLQTAASPSSAAAASYMSIFAMIITVLFLIVIILQDTRELRDCYMISRFLEYFKSVIRWRKMEKPSLTSRATKANAERTRERSK